LTDQPVRALSIAAEALDERNQLGIRPGTRSPIAELRFGAAERTLEARSRRACAGQTSFGLLPEQMDFDDYRAVGAMKLPFLIRRSTPSFSNTQKYEEITLNVPVDASIFKRP